MVARTTEPSADPVGLAPMGGPAQPAAQPGPQHQRGLSTDALELYRVAASYPGTDFTVGVAAHMLERRDDETARLLGTLVRAGLFEHIGGWRYRIAPTTSPAEDAARPATAAEPAERRHTGAEHGDERLILERALAGYHSALRIWHHRPLWKRLRAWDLPTRAGDDGAEPGEVLWEWLARELTNLRAAVEAARGHGLDEQVSDLLAELWRLVLRHRLFDLVADMRSERVSRDLRAAEQTRR